MRLLARLLVDAVHRLAQARSLLLGAAADRFEILGDRSGARARRFRGQAGDVARAFARGFERLVEHAGKAREPLFQIAGLAVERGGELLQRGAALGKRARGPLVAGIDERDRFRERAGMGVELAGDLAEIVERLRGHCLEARDVALHVAVRRAGLLCHVVHGCDEVGDARDQRALDVAHVLVRAAEHLLEQNVGLAQAFVECGRVRPQHVLRLLDLGDGARRRLPGLLDRRVGRLLELLERAGDGLCRAFGGHFGGFAQLLDRTADGFAGRFGRRDVARLQVLERLIDGAGCALARLADEARDLLAVVHHGLGEVEAFGLDRLDRMLGDAADLAHEFLALVGERGEQPARFLVDDARHFGGALAHRRRNLLGLADEIARHLGADRQQRAFHLTGVLLEHVAHAGRHAADHALGVVRAGADRGRGAGRELGQRTLGLGAVGLDRLAELLDAGIDGAGGGGREVAERALRLAGAGLDRAGELLRARPDRLDRGRERLRGVAGIGPDRAAEMLGTRGQQLGGRLAARVDFPGQAVGAGDQQIGGRLAARVDFPAQAVGARGQQLGGRLAARLDFLGQALGARGEQVDGGLAARLDLLGHALGAPAQKILETADARIQIVGDLHRFDAQRPVDVVDLGADAVGELGAARVDDAGDVGDALVERADHFVAALGDLPGDVRDAGGERLAERLGAAVEGVAETIELLVEARGDLGRLDRDAGVEIVQVLAHRAGNVLRALAQTFDHLAAIGLHRAVELGQMPSDYIAERAGVAGDAFGELGAAVVEHVLERLQPRREQLAYRVPAPRNGVGKLASSLIEHLLERLQAGP